MNILFNRLSRAKVSNSLFSNLKKKSLWPTKASSRAAAPSKNFVGFLLGLTTLHELKRYSTNIYCNDAAPTEEAQSPENVERSEKIALMKKITSYEVGLSSEFEEGKIKEVRVMHEGKEVAVCITRVEGRLYATSALCTYDDKTPLKDGVVFGDKLYVPIYGTAYSVKSGSVEYGPSFDNLAIFFVREKDGKVTIGLPTYPPKKVRPMTTFRDYNDLRKVVIIGSGVAAMAAIMTLRENGFTGEIRMVSSDTLLPYDKTKLSKSFKNINYDDLYLRPEEFYEEHGIEYLLGREVKVVNNKHGKPHVVLEDGLRIEYDALLVASGTRPEHREIEGLGAQENVSFLANIQDHKKIRENLDKVKNVTIIGANVIGLETAATIRTEYPHINVHVIDENETLAIDDKFGREIADAILDLHKKNGVQFTFARQIQRFHGNEQSVNKIELEGEREIKTDFVIMFPNICSANTDYLFEGENIDSMEFDDEDRLKVNFNQRSGHKRIFGAGDATAGMYFAQSRRMPCDNYYTAYHTGQVAAYNMLALDIPNAIVPFTYTKQYNQYFNYSGYAAYYNEMHIEGDVKNMDFIVYYSLLGTVLAAFGSEKRKKDMLVLNEAFRLDLMPTFEDIKRGAATPTSIEKNIRESKRSGCFKDLINDIKYSANPDEVVWMQREKSNEYHNFWKEGLQHMGANEVPQEFDN